MDASGPKGTDASGNPILQASAVRSPCRQIILLDGVPADRCMPPDCAWRPVQGAARGTQAAPRRRNRASAGPGAPPYAIHPPTHPFCNSLQDIGVFLRDVFKRKFKGVDVKYIGG